MNRADSSISAGGMSAQPIAWSGDVSQMKNRCESRPAFEPSRGSAWNGWGFDTGNSRFYRGQLSYLEIIGERMIPHAVPRLLSVSGTSVR